MALCWVELGRVGSDLGHLLPQLVGHFGLFWIFSQMRVFIVICVSTTTSEKEERRTRKKDEEREVPDPRESIEDTPIMNFYQVWSKSDFRELSFEQQT